MTLPDYSNLSGSIGLVGRHVAVGLSVLSNICFKPQPSIQNPISFKFLECFTDKELIHILV